MHIEDLAAKLLAIGLGLDPRDDRGVDRMLRTLDESDILFDERVELDFAEEEGFTTRGDWRWVAEGCKASPERLSVLEGPFNSALFLALLSSGLVPSVTQI